MKKTITLIFFVLIGQNLFAQSVLKLRMGVGYYTSFSGHAVDVFMPFDEQGSNGLIHFGSKKMMSLYDNVEYPFLVEYEHNQSWGFSTGILLNSFAPINHYFDVAQASSVADPNTGKYSVGAGGYMTWGVGFSKIPFMFSLRISRLGYDPEKAKRKEKAFFIQMDLLAGGGLWFRRGPKQPHQYTYLKDWENEDVNGGKYHIRADGTAPNKYYGCVAGGLAFRFRTRKHEYARLSITYEQGLGWIASSRIRYDYTINNKTYDYGGPSVFTRGSNLSFRLDFPIFTYNISRKKFYHD